MDADLVSVAVADAPTVPTATAAGASSAPGLVLAAAPTVPTATAAGASSAALMAASSDDSSVASSAASLPATTAAAITIAAGDPSKSTMTLNVVSGLYGTKVIPNSRPQVCQFDYNGKSEDQNFRKNCLVSAEELQDRIETSLMVQMKGVLVKIITCPFSVYVCQGLRQCLHWRSTFPQGEQPKHQCPMLEVPLEADEFIHPQDLFHVYRHGAPFFEPLLKTMLFDLRTVVQLTMRHGEKDFNRKGGLGRVINFGINAEYGNIQFGQTPADFTAEMSAAEKNSFLYSVSSISQLVWEAMKDMCLRAMQPNLANDGRRSNLLTPLLNFLSNNGKVNIPYDAPFEWFTISVMVIWPNLNICEPHFDKKNCRFLNYGRTGCANFVVRDINGTLYLLQIILNFRVSIEQKVFPYYDHVEACVSQTNNFRMFLLRRYREIFRKNSTDSGNRSMSFLRDPFDMTDMFLDKHLQYGLFDIHSKKNTTIRPLKALRVPIGLSRTVSLSAILSAIFQKGNILKFDQALELCFMASFINCQLRFYYILSQLTQQLLDDTYGGHPLLFYLAVAERDFGTYQGGKEPRYKSCGHSMKEMKYLLGDKKVLCEILKVLLSYVSWMDSQRHCETAADLPISTIEKELKRLQEGVNTAISTAKGEKTNRLEFGSFRAQIFTTLISGLQLVLPGTHLLNMMVPLNDQASRTQLQEATKNAPDNAYIQEAIAGNFYFKANNLSSYEFTKMPDIFFDDAMEIVSFESGFLVYYRNNIESVLCEGRDGRLCFVRYYHLVYGQTIHDLREGGCAMYKEFGKYKWISNSHWPRVFCKSHNLGYVDDVSFDHLLVKSSST